MIYKFTTFIKYIFIRLIPVSLIRKLIRYYAYAPRQGNISQRRLLVDVSVIIREDARTGIQRVVRGILQHLLLHPPQGYSVCPVYATKRQPYRFASDLPGLASLAVHDETVGATVHARAGDIFLGLDLCAHLLPVHYLELMRWKLSGVEFYFIIYDLLPVLHPNWFHSKTSQNIKRWLRVVTGIADSLICISGVVKNDMIDWMGSHYRLNGCAPPVRTISLGADIASTVPNKGLPPDIEDLMKELFRNPSILIVGTLEPRKGHTHVLSAFEILWRKGRAVNLVIVGKPGWKTSDLQRYLHSHEESQLRLFWLSEVSDEMLEMLYVAATGVIFASESEGFGQSLIEALHYKKPVLARDIPVFREIGRHWVTYFRGKSPEALAETLDNWLSGIERGLMPVICEPQRTWFDSVQYLLSCLKLNTFSSLHDNDGHQ